MGGQYHAKRYEHLGVQRKSDYQAPPEAFTIIEEVGHYLHDPYSPTEAPEYLVRSIDERGVLQPISVVTDGAALLVAIGRSRVRATIAANARRAARTPPAPPRNIPYVLLDGTDKSLREAKDAENLHRRRTGPAVRAEIAAEYKAQGYPDDRIADLCALDEVAHVAPLLAVVRCAPAIREAMEIGRIEWTLAPDFAKLPRPEQIARGQALLDAGVRGGARAKRIIANKTTEPKTKPKPRGAKALTKRAETAEAACALAYKALLSVVAGEGGRCPGCGAIDADADEHSEDCQFKAALVVLARFVDG